PPARAVYAGVQVQPAPSARPAHHRHARHARPRLDAPPAGQGVPRDGAGRVHAPGPLPRRAGPLQRGRPLRGRRVRAGAVPVPGRRRDAATRRDLDRPGARLQCAGRRGRIAVRPGRLRPVLHTGNAPIANWTSTRMVGADLVGEAFSAGGVAVRGGLMARLYGIRALERVRAHEAGVAPIYNEFDPATLSGFAEVQVVTGDLHARAGVRVEAFRSGLDLTHDPDGGGPRVLTPGWKHSIMPRLGVALPVTAQTSFRANFGWVAQPPDFSYFMDTTLGDSLRTDIHRQGNPDLGFE